MKKLIGGKILKARSPTFALNLTVAKVSKIKILIELENKKFNLKKIILNPSNKVKQLNKKRNIDVKIYKEG